MGLIAIVKKGYTFLGNIAFFAIIIPMFIGIPRVIRKDREDKRKAMESGN